MPLKAPEWYELDRSDSPRPSLDEGSHSDFSEVNEFDPLKNDKPYTDDASQPLRSIFDSEKSTSGAWRGARGRRPRLCMPSRFCCILVATFLATLLLLLSAGGLWVYKASVPKYGQSEPWYPTPQGGTVDPWRESYKRAAELVGRMTLVEKVNVTTGTGWSMDMCVGNTGRVDRVGFPSLCLQDGPLGLRFADNITAFPAGVTVGATWNKELMYERGRAHGLEARLKGINVILGPGVGPLGYLPAGGRNWEGFGGDPVLQGLAAAQTISGIQSQGVMATIKHFVGNEQEHYRQSWEWGTPNAISSNIDDRALHEVFAWPFADAIRAGVASVMCSYNQVNNSYACQNSKLLNGVLKDELGFQGFVQSDWLAQRSGVASALAGLDMSMPGDGLTWQDGKSLWGSELTKAVLNSSVPMDRLNDMVTRIVAAWYQLGQDDEQRWPNATSGGGPNFSSWSNNRTGLLHPGSPGSTATGVVNQFVPVRETEEGGNHDTLARRIAAEGIVLVKNEDNVLPLSRNGSNITTNGRAGRVKIGIFGEDGFSNPAGHNACEDRGCNVGTLAMGWGSGAVELPYLISPHEALKNEFDRQTVELVEWRTNEVKHIDLAAHEQDLCIVFINSDAGEGFIKWDNIRGDRNNLYPQKGGDKLVQKVAAHCGGNTVVVLHTVGPTILEKWIDIPGVKSVLVAHLPGQESGHALADVLFGDVNPSGHLPYTIARAESDYGPASSILRIPNGVVPQQNFTDLWIDYRYFDKFNVTPRYAFGYGLSYTSFQLSGLFVHMFKSSGGPYPAARPKGIEPPHFSPGLPAAETALWPKGLRKLKKYVYPYITKLSEIKPGRYPYPEGYDRWHSPSAAGGGEGGNPDLYAPVASVQASLINTGPVAGDCVVQMYISYPAKVVSPASGLEVDMPVRVLRNWIKLSGLGPASSSPAAENHRQFKLELTRRDLSYWDVAAQNWVMPEGQYTVWFGYSSRDLRESKTIEIRHQGVGGRAG